jgi:hypothetical protein
VGEAEAEVEADVEAEVVRIDIRKGELMSGGITATPLESIRTLT